jgi:hypothetical protein
MITPTDVKSFFDWSSEVKSLSDGLDPPVFLLDTGIGCKIFSYK